MSKVRSLWDHVIGWWTENAAHHVYTKAPAAAPIYNWAGFYVGFNAGGASSHDCWDATAAFGSAVWFAVFTLNSSTLSAGVGMTPEGLL